MKRRKFIILGIITGIVILILGSWVFSSKKQTTGIIQLFDELDNKVNNGKGYSNYLNTDGFPTGALLAWSESYLMQAYANMYRATGDIKYLNKLYEHIYAVLASRDDKIGQKNYRNELSPTWGTNRYTKNKEWMNFLVHTGMITYPMLEFIQLIKNFNIEVYAYAGDEILRKVEQSIKYHDKEWKENHYVYPEDFYKKDYIIPINQQAAMGRSVILLYKLTGKQDYLEKAKLLAKFIKDKSIQKNNAGGYVLRDAFLPGKTIPEDKIVDISHAALTIHFAYLAYKNGIVFNREDMKRFAKTIKQLAVDNGNHFPKYLDGTGNFDYEVVASQYSFLSEFDRAIYDSLTDLFFNHLKIDSTAKYMQEDWWGVVMLGLSRLALYQSS